MNVQLFCYNKGLAYLQKEVEKIKKKRDKVSQELFEMIDENSTMRRRSMTRVKLDTLCEELQQKEMYLQQVKELIREIVKV